jgi:hypothetical protein
MFTNAGTSSDKTHTAQIVKESDQQSILPNEYQQQQ